MTSHETGTPDTPRATAPPPRTFGPQGPTLGELSDAYLQDYQVRQFRSQSTARGRIAHLTAFFGRAARAAALTTYQIRQYQLARRAAGAATGTINRETSALHRMGTLAVHWGWLDTVPGFPDRLRENPPRQGFFEHPEYLAVRAHLPAPWQDIPRPRLLLRLAQERDPRPHLGRDRRGRRRHPALAGPLEDVGGADSPDLATHCRGPRATAGAPRPHESAGLPPRRHPRPPLAHGVAHRLSGGRGADPLPPRLPPHRRPQSDPRQRRRAGRHAPDRAQEPRHLRPLQHHQRARTARGRGPAGRLSGAARTGDAAWRAAPPGPHRRPAHRAAPSPRATHHRVRRASGPPAPARRRGPRGRGSPDTRPSVRRDSRPGHTTGRADAADHGHARDGSSSATRGWASVHSTSRSHSAPSRTASTSSRGGVVSRRQRRSSPPSRGGSDRSVPTPPRRSSPAPTPSRGTRATRTRHPIDSRRCPAHLQRSRPSARSSWRTGRSVGADAARRPCGACGPRNSSPSACIRAHTVRSRAGSDNLPPAPPRKRGSPVWANPKS